jgi:aldose 1-epimerase
MIEIRNGDLIAQIDPLYGNNVRSLKLRGAEFVWSTELGRMDGVPMLGPWANRIDGLEYFVDGRKYRLNPALENLQFDLNGMPIHGLLLFSDRWKVIAQDEASVTSRLEFWKSPAWMAQFPFAHAIGMTHRLRDGWLEIETAIENLCDQPMPVAIGFHPFFQLTDSPREEWRVQIAARRHVFLSDKLIPTGETEPIKIPNPFPLRGAELDAVFDDLTGDAFVIKGRAQRLEVRFGAKYPVAIVYAPAGQSFVGIEPMSALTNAFNLDHSGIPANLQHVAPGGTWRESFWMKPFGRYTPA